MKLRLGTRGSDLATTQSKWVADELARQGIEIELVIISTSGDRSTAATFGAIGPQGVFVREIEQALSSGEIDFAVHSYKDLPTQSPEGLTVAAVPPRRDAADWLFYRRNGGSGAKPASALASDPSSFMQVLAPGARVGTASARRQAWLKHFAPALEIDSLRGNVPTRLRRLAAGDFDGILLAGAGIERLAQSSDLLDESLARVEQLRLDPLLFVPAPAQGALAVQCRADDGRICKALSAIDDSATHQAIQIERAALALAEGGCDSAFGAYASAAAGGFELSVMTEKDGQILSASISGAGDAQLAERAFARLTIEREGVG